MFSTLATLTSPPSLAPTDQANRIREPLPSLQRKALQHASALITNSMDAISFVLGIKSSHLRSSHLRDLVYRGRVLRTAKINEDGSATENGVNGHVNGNGHAKEGEDGEAEQPTQERNDPTSAWVMAVYEDDAGDEQLWKRTITSQGTSEYRINNRIVSAQQYNEAMEAENILVKARNFLVFQGDVEAIASQSPKDLTKLIEQISGSLEYKAEYERLKEAQEEALENQNFNLNRRRGMNSEIKQYQEQKREADSYAKKADQRDQATVTHILYKLCHLQKAIEESSEEIRKHQEEVKEHRRGLAKYEQNLEDAKKEQSKVGREIGKVERSIKSKEKDIEDKENSLVPISEKILLTREDVQKKNTRATQIGKERDRRSDTIKQWTKDLKVVEKAEAEWNAEWAKTSRQEGRALSEDDLQEYNGLREEVNKRSSEDQTKVDNLTRQQRADEETVNSLKSKVESIEGQVTRYKEEIDEVKQLQKSAQKDKEQTEKDIKAKKNELHVVTSERLRLAQVRTELDEKLQECLTKLLEAEDGRKQSDKELRFKATVADMKRMFPGVRGRVSELCKPKQKKFEEAVSTVLGRHFDAVVVDNEQTAKDCIQYLRDQRRGQATFIPHDTISTKDINTNLKGMKGTWMAIDTIDYERSVERAMKYVCGNAMVCDNLKTAKQMAYDKGVDAKVVTLDGTVIHKAGLMTGGRGREQKARWEDVEVENLRKLAEKLRKELGALPEVRRNATEEETLQGDLTGLGQKLKDMEDDIKAHQRNLADKQKVLANVQSQLSDVKPKYREKLGNYEDLTGTIDSYREAVHEVEDEIFANFCERLGYDNIRIYESQQGSLQQEASQKKLEFRQQKTKLESRISFEQQQLQETSNRIKVLEDRVKQDEASIAQLESDKDVISDESDTLAAEVEQLKEQLEQQQTRYAKRAEKVAEQRKELQKRSKDIEGTIKTISSFEAEIQRNATDRFAILRKCRLEDITIPLTEESEGLDKIPIDGAREVDPDAMDVDEDPDSTNMNIAAVQDYGIEVDFDELDDDLKEVSTIQ